MHFLYHFILNFNAGYAIPGVEKTVLSMLETGYRS